jgi:hypothetical protein
MDWILDNPVNVGAEIFRLLPDGVIIITGFFALLTANYAYGILFISLIESLGIYSIVSKIAKHFKIFNNLKSSGNYSAKCVTGFLSPTLETISVFTGVSPATFPSAPVFLISVLSSYIYNSLSSQIKELEALGPKHSSRFYLSAIFLGIFLFTFSLFRLFANCDTFGSILASLVMGVLVGSLLIAQNNAFFGPQGTNLLGIPLLKNRTASGNSLYICPTQGS